MISYVIYNYLENSWYFGTMDRSTYQDNGVELNPLATDIQLILQLIHFTN
jgi:hypothetical protein